MTIKSIILSSILSTSLISLFVILSNFGLMSQLSVPDWLKNAQFNPVGNPYYFLTLAVPVLLSAIAYGVISRNWLIKPIVLAGVVIIATASVFSLKTIFPGTNNAGLSLLPYSAGWSIAVDTLKTLRSALIGTGPDSFAQTYARLKPASINQTPFWSVIFASSSSEFLTLITTVGILGFISILMLFVNSIKAIAKEKFTKDPETAFIFTALATIFLSFILLPVSLSTYVFTSVILIAAVIKMKLTGSKYVKDVILGFSARPITPIVSDRAKTSKLPVAPWIITILSLTALAVFWTGAVKAYQAQLAMYDAAKNVKDNPVVAYNKQIEALQLDPSNPYIHVSMSQTYLSITQSYLSKKDATDEDKKTASDFANQAMNEAETATNLSPLDFSVWLNLASVARTLATLGVNGAGDIALAAYNQAARLAPTDPSVITQFGTFFASAGDAENATRMIQQAISLKSDWNVPLYNLAVIYRTQKDYAKALSYMQAALQYTDPKSKDYETLKKEVDDLKKLAPAPSPTPTPAQ